MTSLLHSFQSKPLSGEIIIPGDKSISHRALIIASQIIGKTTITGLLEGEDVLNTAKALQALGVPIHRNGVAWEVQGVGVGGLVECKDVLDMGNSGTSTRLLMGLVAPYPYTTFFTGDDSLRVRPMGRVAIPLREMGARIIARDGQYLPLAVSGTAAPLPITYHLPVASAQVKSAILLAGLYTRGKTTVIEPVPTRDHTERMLKYFGFSVDREAMPRLKNTPPTAIAISVHGHPHLHPASHEITIPGDPSSAAFPLVAALIRPGSKLTLKNICINPLRTGLFTTLKEMGAKINYINERNSCGEQVADIEVISASLKAVTVPAERAPSMIDEYPILAVAAAFADGETIMHGLSELRVKESDRLSAVVNMLTACGVSARAEGDSLYVTGAKSVMGGAMIHAKHDHRMAMSALVLGTATDKPVRIDGAESIATSFPNFIQLMNRLGADIRSPDAVATTPVTIAIDGPAGSGKGTLARRLAEYFDLEYLDTGSLYRAVGLKLIYSGKDPKNKDDAIEAATNIDVNDLSNPRLRQERIGQAASVVSAYPEVRAALLEFQRNFAKGKKGAVLDGRDIGTVILPDADFKFFITATLYARAKRRHKELEGEGIEVVFDSVLEDLRERDERDEKRAVAPLKPASDAIIMDTSDMDASEVFEKAKTIIQHKGSL